MEHIGLHTDYINFANNSVDPVTQHPKQRREWKFPPPLGMETYGYPTTFKGDNMVSVLAMMDEVCQ